MHLRYFGLKTALKMVREILGGTEGWRNSYESVCIRNALTRDNGPKVRYSVCKQTNKRKTIFGQDIKIHQAEPYDGLRVLWAEFSAMYRTLRHYHNIKNRRTCKTNRTRFISKWGFWHRSSFIRMCEKCDETSYSLYNSLDVLRFIFLGWEKLPIGGSVLKRIIIIMFKDSFFLNRIHDKTSYFTSL